MRGKTGNQLGSADTFLSYFLVCSLAPFGKDTQNEKMEMPQAQETRVSPCFVAFLQPQEIKTRPEEEQGQMSSNLSKPTVHRLAMLEVRGETIKVMTLFLHGE